MQVFLLFSSGWISSLALFHYPSFKECWGCVVLEVWAPSCAFVSSIATSLTLLFQLLIPWLPFSWISVVISYFYIIVHNSLSAARRLLCPSLLSLQKMHGHRDKTFPCKKTFRSHMDCRVLLFCHNTRPKNYFVITTGPLPWLGLLLLLCHWQ